jgi:hypothetical protein
MPLSFQLEVLFSKVNTTLDAREKPGTFDLWESMAEKASELRAEI